MAAGDPKCERRYARFVLGEGLEDRTDRGIARRVVVRAGAYEREHARRVRDRDGPEPELLEDLVGESSRGAVREAEPQLRQRRGQQLERWSLAAQSANAGHCGRTVASASCMSTMPSWLPCVPDTASRSRSSGRARSRSASTRWPRTTPTAPTTSRCSSSTAS